MRRVLAALGLTLAAAFAVAQQPVPVPKLTGHVVDLTATLDSAQKSALEAKLASFEAQRGSQVVVLLVPTTQPEAIEEFAGRVTDDWKLGRKGVDDGVLFVVAKDDRKLRIHTGRGVQGTLTDALSKRITADIVAPYFRKGDFAGGVNAGTEAIMKAVEGEALPLPAKRPASHASQGSGISFPELAFLAFVLVPVVGLVLRGMFGRFFGATLTSGLTAAVVWFLIGSVALVVVGGLLAFVFTLFSGMGLARGNAPRAGQAATFPPAAGAAADSAVAVAVDSAEAEALSTAAAPRGSW